MDNVEQPLSGSADRELSDDGPGMTSRDAAETLIGAVDRAGPPWSFVPSDSLAGRDLQAGGGRTWPLVLSDGEMLGIVVRARGGSGQHDELIMVLLRTVTALVAAEQEAAAAQRRADLAEQAARVDPLTGLLNRRAWDDALEKESARMRRSGKAAVVVVVDIDSLKETNDTEGHLAGDLLIRRAAEGLRAAVRDVDVVARLGGDEFGVLAVESGTEVPDTLLKRIDEGLRAVDVQASVGASAARSGTSLHEALASADREMYAAKRQRKRARRA
jgi:diguanylate cyclase (GGDEF)-like protein